MVTKIKVASKGASTAAQVVGESTNAEEKSEKAPVVVVRRKEMVERIVASSGLKPNQIKSVLDAVLKELGDALSEGETLNLSPLGKLSVNRQKDVENGKIIICKLRRVKAPKSDSLEAAE